jgi:hypothetical protein
MMLFDYFKRVEILQVFLHGAEIVESCYFKGIGRKVLPLQSKGMREPLIYFTTSMG